MPLPKGRLATRLFSFFAVLNGLLGVVAGCGTKRGMLVALSLCFGCFGLK